MTNFCLFSSKMCHCQMPAPSYWEQHCWLMSLFLALCIRCPLCIVWLGYYLFQPSSTDKHSVSGENVRPPSCGFLMVSHLWAYSTSTNGRKKLLDWSFPAHFIFNKGIICHFEETCIQWEDLKYHNLPQSSNQHLVTFRINTGKGVLL